MINITLYCMCVCLFSTALCAVWTIRAANRIANDYNRLLKLEKEYQRYLDSLLRRAFAILASIEDYQTTITVTSNKQEQEK